MMSPYEASVVDLSKYKKKVNEENWVNGRTGEVTVMAVTRMDRVCSVAVSKLVPWVDGGGAGGKK